MPSKLSWFLICLPVSLICWVSISKFSSQSSREIEDPIFVKNSIESTVQANSIEADKQSVQVVPTSSEMRDNAQGVPVQPGKDPFKEFLDKQKQNSKDQVVSPFGKN